MKTFYHISKIENKESILSDGLLGNDEGQVFLLTEDTFINPYTNKETKVSEYIAKGQLFLDEYSLFKVTLDDSEMEWIHKDNVAEITANNQFIYIGDIDSSNIEYVGDFNIY